MGMFDYIQFESVNQVHPFIDGLIGQTKSMDCLLNTLIISDTKRIRYKMETRFRRPEQEISGMYGAVDILFPQGQEVRAIISDGYLQMINELIGEYGVGKRLWTRLWTKPAVMTGFDEIHIGFSKYFDESIRGQIGQIRVLGTSLSDCVLTPNSCIQKESNTEPREFSPYSGVIDVIFTKRGPVHLIFLDGWLKCIHELDSDGKLGRSLFDKESYDLSTR